MNRFVACLLFALAAVSAAQAQVAKWPDKPVRVIVPFPAGGTTDVVARSFAPRLSEEYGQQSIVDNRVGAVDARCFCPDDRTRHRDMVKSNS